MSRFKVGDMVRIAPEEVIRSFEPYGGGFRTPDGLYVNIHMLESCGKDYVIKKRTYGVDRYMLRGSEWTWSESCFEDPAKMDFTGLEDLL